VKARYYSPQISRVLVCALYHEAQRQRKPMTRLTDELLFAALRRSIGFRMARARFITAAQADRTSMLKGIENRLMRDSDGDRFAPQSHESSTTLQGAKVPSAGL